MLRTKRSVQVAYPVKRTFEIRPVAGMFDQEPAQEIPLGGSPDMVNCYVLSGLLRKRPGYAQWKTDNAAIGSSVVGIYSTQDEENNTHLFAVHPTGLAKYNSSTLSWDAMTGTALTGGASQLFSFENSQNSMVFSQGVDQVMRMPFTGSAYAILNASCPATKFLTRFADRLFLAYTLESAVSKPFRIRRCVAQDHTDWTGVGSGFTDLAEFPYHIRQIRKLGTMVAVYTEHNIWFGIRTEQVASPARFEPKITDLGLYAAFTLAGAGETHLFLGNDDIYQLTDAGQLVPVGRQVRDSIFSELNAAALAQMFGVTLSDTQEYVCFVCTGSDTTPGKAWVYNWSRQTWYPWTFSGPKCGTIHRLDDTITIDSLVGTIDAQTWEFDSRLVQAAYPSLLTGHTDGKIYQWSTTYAADAGSAISCRWTSKDFTAADLDPLAEGRQITLTRLTISYKDTGASATLSLEYSTDGGNSWSSADSVTLTGSSGGFREVTTWRQVTGNKIRFRFRHSSATETFQIAAFYPTLELRGMPIT